MLSRRIVLSSALGTAAAATLAACAAGTQESGPSPSETAEAEGNQQPSSFMIGPASEVPVGGGAKFRAGDTDVFITQPTSGDFRAFDARCTHAGCAVTAVVMQEIECPCHGAKYNFETGEVISGPAPRALGKLTVNQVGDQLEVSF